MGYSLKSVVSPLPAIVREGTVGFRHPMHVFTLLDGVSPAIRCVEQLGREPLRHRLFIALARRHDDPANAECLTAHGAHFDRHLIGGATDAARTYFDRRHHVLKRLLENRQRALLGLGLDQAERAIDYTLGGRLLAVVHHRVHELRDDDVPELRIRLHFTFFSRMAARHLVCSRLFRTLRAVLRTALLAVLDALGIEDAAENVVTHARQILDAAAADHDHRVLLKVMAFTRNVADDLEAIGQPYLGDLAKRRVRLLRGRGVDARANAALLRRLLQRRHLLARLLYNARTCDQLVDRRHVSLHPLVRAKPASAPQILSGLPVPSGRIARKHPRKAKSRQLLIAERKALRRHRGPQSKLVRVSCSVGYRGHASEINLERTCSREPRSSWHCLAIIDSV